MENRKYTPVTDMDSFRTMKNELKWTIIDKFFGPDLDKSVDLLFTKMKRLKNILKRKYASKSQDTLISIIMPTFNRAKVIPLAIRSVLRQTYRNWELIIVDDGGRDDTKRVVQAFKDPRIRYFKKESIKVLVRQETRDCESLPEHTSLIWIPIMNGIPTTYY